MKNKRLLRAFLSGMITLFISFPVFAFQTISVINNAKVQALVSETDFNRIYVQGDRILTVRGDQGAYTIQTDPMLGQIYIKPYSNMPFNLYLMTEQGNTYQLHLEVRQGAANTIVLQPPVTTPAQAANWESSTPYEQTLVRLMRAMATGSFPDGYSITATHDKALPLGAVATVTRISQYQGVNLMGEIFIIKNLSRHIINLKPEQLYRAGSMAIALQNQTIAPLGQTRLFVITQGEPAHA